ncbi:MAG: adenosylmethionine decarboxylase [Candidatus Magnetoovum sp. WYHC-5]|nr:adenosylmethionine decarboxylase [Candidatus Magnetoovum sp. WYHC-5]
MIELRDCNEGILNDLQKITNLMVNAAKRSKATIVDVSFHEFNPYGISGMVIIAESHLSIHTWPEYNYAAVDIFTCGNLIDPKVAADYLIEGFGCKDPYITYLKRGYVTNMVDCTVGATETTYMSDVELVS